MKSRMLLGLIPLLLLSGCGKNEPPKITEPQVKQVRLMTLKSSKRQLGRSFAATIQAKDTANVSFRVPGLVLEIPVSSGQNVKKGDVIAKLDPRDFQTKVTNVKGQLKEAQSNLQALKKGAREEDIQRLKAGVAAAQAQFDEAQKKYDRNSELYEKSVIAAQEFEAFKSALEVAKSNLQVAKKELEIGQRGARAEDISAGESRVKSLQASLKQAEDALKDTVLTAPFAGVIAQTYPNEHEEITAGAPVARLQDISGLEAKVYVAENVIAWISSFGEDIKNVQQAITSSKVSFPSIDGKKFDTVISSYQTDADPTTQTYEVTFVLNETSDKRILPGMNGTLEVTAKSGNLMGATSFIIPGTAIFANSSGEKCVWVVDPKTQAVSKRPVKTDHVVGASIIVIDGLKSGEVIATTAANTLREGMKVEKLADLRKL